MIAWTRVHAISAVLMESDARLQSTSPEKGKTVWEHSPTRRKTLEILHSNRGAPLIVIVLSSPQCYQGPLYPWALRLQTLLPRGAPHERPRGPVCVASCHESTPPAPRAGRPGSAMWPQCRVAPRGSLARHVSRRSPRQPAG